VRPCESSSNRVKGSYSARAEIRGGLVQDEERCLPLNGTGHGEPLPLASRQRQRAEVPTQMCVLPPTAGSSHANWPPLRGARPSRNAPAASASPLGRRRGSARPASSPADPLCVRLLVWPKQAEVLSELSRQYWETGRTPAGLTLLREAPQKLAGLRTLGNAECTDQ